MYVPVPYLMNQLWCIIISQLITRDKTPTQKRHYTRSSTNDRSTWSKVSFSTHQSVNCPIGRLYNSLFIALIINALNVDLMKSKRKTCYLCLFPLMSIFMTKCGKVNRLLKFIFRLGCKSQPAKWQL